nr:C25 family cysteine peptidase [Prolixibacteraceae bacterium]
MKRFCNFLLICLFLCFGLISRATTINFHVRFEPDLKIATQTADDGNLYSKVSLSGYKMELTEGAPQLPVRYIKLIIPSEEEPSFIEYSKGNAEVLQIENLVYPAQKPIPTSTEFTGNEFVNPDKEIYNSDSYYPSERVKVLRTDCVRGNKVVSLAVLPICYNPVKGQVEFVTEIEITLHLKNSDKKPLTAPVRSKEQFDSYLKSLVDNEEDVEKYSVIKQKQASGEAIDMKSTKSTSGISINCDYVIITPSSLSSNFNDFIQWKRQKGIDIELVTTEAISSAYSGDDISGINDEAGKVRQFLYEAYQNGLEYALLGGEGSTVPFRYGTGWNNSWDRIYWNINNSSYDTIFNAYKIPADLYYSEFEGDWDVDSDQFLGESDNDDVRFGVDIFVGRLLCNAGGYITDWTNKVMWYEKNPGNGSASYLRKAFYTQADQMQEDD